MTKKYRILVLTLLCVMCILCGCSGKQTTEAGTELLKNGDFSVLAADGLPADWYTDAYLIEKVYTDYEVIEEDGAHILHITNFYPNDARLVQEVNVDPDRYYLLHGFVKADAAGGLGANLSIGDIYAFSESVYDSEGEWIEISYYGKTDSERKSVKVFARLGGYGGEAGGEAWFKDLSLIQVESIPEGCFAAQWYTQSQANKLIDDDDVDAQPTASRGMMIILLTAGLYLLFAENLLLFMRKARPTQLETKKTKEIIHLVVLLLLAAVARVVFAILIPGYDVDIGCFTSWTATMQSSLPWGFYANSGFCDYPPGYMLVLWIFSLGMKPTALMVKMPSIVFDQLLSILIYTEGKKRINTRMALAMACLYAFNPMTLVTGAAWGQSDAAMTGLLILSVIYAMRGNWKAALPVYTLSVLMKPQALMFGPVGLIALVLHLIFVFRKKADEKKPVWKSLIDVLIGVGISFTLLVITSLLFMGEQDIFWLVKLYGETMGSYAYTTVNACNSYFLAGLNWAAANGGMSLGAYLMILMTYALPSAAMLIVSLRRYLKNKELPENGRKLMHAVIMFGVIICMIALGGLLMKAFGWLTYANFSAYVIVCNVLLVGYLYIKNRDIHNLPLCGAFLLVLLFNTGSMMHERYLFPVIGLLIIAYLANKDRRLILLMIGITIAGFLNVGCVLERNIRIGGVAAHLSAPIFGISSDMAVLEYLSAGLNVLMCMVTLYIALDMMALGHRAGELSLIRGKRDDRADENTNAEKTKAQNNMDSMLLKKHEKRTSRLSVRDVLIMTGITLAYSVLAFTNLGSMKAPETYYKAVSANEQIIFDLGSAQDFKVMYFCGIQNVDEYTFKVSVSDDGKNWGAPFEATAEDGDCFRWKYVANGVVYYGRYVRLETGAYPGLWLNEVLCRTAEGDTPIPMTMISGPEGAEALCDEPDTLEGEPEDWWNSTYFDEIYHARTAYEHLHSLVPYETTHPPLGKVIMSWGVAIFGMCPFGWRFMGTLSGVLMLPAIYMLGRLLLKKRRFAVGAMLMLTLDQMHFTQTRIATIDTFVVLFILWSLYFMVYWVKQDWFGTKFWRTLVPLGMSGLFMGLSIASKMTGCYNGIALALIFFITLFARMRQASKAKQMLADENNEKLKGSSDAGLIPDERREAVRTAAGKTGKRVIITLLCCLVFFILIPAVIYYCSYIPYFSYAHGGVTVKRVIDAFYGMLRYHSQPGLGMDHFFYSPWYEWPLNLRPMWYYMAANPAPGMDSTIMSMGNPVVWLGGLLGFIGCILLTVRDYYCRTRGLYDHGVCAKMTHTPQLLIVIFAAQYIPWTLVPRGTYIYHYFACVPVICLALMCLLEWADEAMRSRRTVRTADAGTAVQNESKQAAKKISLFTIVLIVYLVLVLAGFIAYFPYASGITVSERWLDAVQIMRNWLWH